VQTPALGLSYSLRVGTSPGSCDVFSGMSGTSNGYRRVPALGNAQKRLSWTLKNMPAGPLYWSVQAIDTGFTGSPWAPEQLLYPRGADVASAKRKDNGLLVTASGCVTAVFGNAFYLEQLDRSSGVRVEKAGHGVEVGMAIVVTGTMRTSLDSERYIECGDIACERDEAINPVMLNNKSLGGGDFEYNSLTGAGQRGVEDGVGLNNIGLLVSATGVVTAVGDDFFYIDDGTHARDASIFNGVRVLCGNLQKPESGRQVVITGVSSVSRVADRVFRGMRPRSQSDIGIMQ